mgnify:CR=1 FL=1
MGINPKTGEKVYVPAKKAPYFRPGKSLKIEVNTKLDAELGNKIFTLRPMMKKFNYDENGQLRTRLAILESQLTVATREADSLKVKNEQLNKIIKKG